MAFSHLVCLFLWLNVDMVLSQTGPAGCQTPPLLENGDLKHPMKDQYSHNERVEYMCQAYHTSEGDSHRICINGEWIGQQRCLKPCTVNDEDMKQKNIAFRYSMSRKMYAAHNDAIDFRCTKGRYIGPMRRRCIDGVMLLPTCR